MSLDETARVLIAVAAAVATNSPPEVKYRISRARELGVQDAELSEAVEIGRLVRSGAISKADMFAASIAVTPPVRGQGGCRRGASGGPGSGGGCGLGRPQAG